MRRLIHLFKYGQKTALQYWGSEIIYSFINANNIDLSEFDLIVPIPLHSTRLRERGYNQAQLLSQSLSIQFAIPQSSNNLSRIRNTKNQARLSAKERWTNIHGAFKIKDSLEYFRRSILLVDDILTTGATASEAARLLKKAGANKVAVLALAITE